jgi:hypothetical protein
MMANIHSSQEKENEGHCNQVKLRIVANGSLVDSMLQLTIIEGKGTFNDQEQKEEVTQNQKIEIKELSMEGLQSIDVLGKLIRKICYKERC